MDISYIITPRGKDVESDEALTLFSVQGENLFVPRVGDTIPYSCEAVPEEAKKRKLTAEQLSGVYKVEEVRLWYGGIEAQLNREPDHVAQVGENMGEAKQNILCRIKRERRF